MNKNSIIGFKKRYNKNKVLYYRKCDSDFAFQYELSLNPDELSLLIVTDGCQYTEEETKKTHKFGYKKLIN